MASSKLSFLSKGQHVKIEILGMETSTLLLCVHAQSLQLCPILCNPIDCSLPGSSVHEILQARILEWVDIPFSRGFFQT